jgi:hypothetical protein
VHCGLQAGLPFFVHEKTTAIRPFLRPLVWRENNLDV